MLGAIVEHCKALGYKEQAQERRAPAMRGNKGWERASSRIDHDELGSLIDFIADDPNEGYRGNELVRSGFETRTEAPENDQPEETALQFSVPLDIDTRCTHRHLERIAHRAFNALNGNTISVTIRQRPTPITLTTQQAQKVVTTFFQEMLGTTMNRLCDIVEYANAYSAAMSATAATVGVQTPRPLQRIYANISILATEDLPHTFHYLRRNIRLVNLCADWQHIRRSLANMDADGRDIVKYLQLPSRGVTNISLAKKALCDHAGISYHKFGDYLRSASVPAALVKHFGFGALLFCPNNTGG